MLRATSRAGALKDVRDFVRSIINHCVAEATAVGRLRDHEKLGRRAADLERELQVWKL